MDIGKEEFEKIISSIDDDLAKKNVSIPKRPVTAAFELLKKLKISAPLFHPYEKDLSFPVKTQNLSYHVYQWYENTYRELTYIDPCPAKFPFHFYGNAYEVALPLLFGNFLIIGSKHKFTDENILNAVDSIKNLPDHVRSKMSGQEEGYIQTIFYTCLEVSAEVKKYKSDLMLSANNDIIVSNDLICGFNKNSALSAWHSLQFIEKILKEYISKNATFPQIHDIKKLQKKAEEFGYKADPNINWGLFNFGPSVRYEPGSIDTELAVRINHEAWRIAYNVLKQM